MRRRRIKEIMVLGIIIAALLAILILLACDRLWGPKAILEEDGARTEEATPAPAADPTDAETAPLPRAWVRYDVDLDDELQQYIDDICAEYDVPASVVMAIIETESGCDPSMVGDGGNSWGLMQIYSTQHTARCVRLGAWNLLDPRMNVRVGVDYLAELLACGHGMEWALSWYNGHGGEPCGYAYTVITRAEQLLESAQLVEE